MNTHRDTAAAPTTLEGRPSKLTPQVQEKLIQALALGNYRKDAAVYAGIDAGTFHRWLSRGATEHDGPFADLRRAVLEAETRAKITSLGCIAKAARDGDWKAAAWMLERKHPHQFAERSQLFLVQKAFEQVEAAAETAGIPLPDEVWQAAWGKVAKEFSLKMPESFRLDPRPEDLEDEIGDIEMTEDEKKVLFKLVQGHRRTQVVDVEVVASSPS